MPGQRLRSLTFSLVFGKCRQGRLPAPSILLILAVKFLQQALKLKYESTTDLLFLALGIVLIGGSIYISHLRSGNGH